MNSKIGINSIVAEVKNKFLSFYKINARDKEGKELSYLMASRNSEDTLVAKTGINSSNAVMVIPRTDNFKFLLIKEFRYAVNDYVYEFPAGLIDDGESSIEAGVRELFEETGYVGVRAKILVDCGYSSVGMTDESLSIIKVKCTGEANYSHNERTEDIEVLELSANELKELLKDKSKKFDLKTALYISALNNTIIDNDGYLDIDTCTKCGRVKINNLCVDCDGIN